MKKLFLLTSFLAVCAIYAAAQTVPELKVDENGHFYVDDDYVCSCNYHTGHNIQLPSGLLPAGFEPALPAEPTQAADQKAAPGVTPAPAPIMQDKQAMIKVSREGEEWFFEVPDSLLGRDILAVTRYTATPAGLGVYGGENIRTFCIYFEKNPSNDGILLRMRQNYMHADTLDAISKAVKISSMEPIIGSFKIEAYKNNYSKIKVTQLLLSDNVFSITPNVKTFVRATAQTAGSYIESIHAFPINTEIRTVRTFNTSTAGVTVSFGVNVSLQILPKVPMQPRLFDPRVGYFADGYNVYSDDQQRVEERVFIVRRRLEPKSEEDRQRQMRGELIEPKKQIVYYIDPATPKQWRSYLIQGVNDWNAAFEQAGWKNAIVGKEWPENDSTMSMEDSRYSVIRYLASDIANAYGPQVHDPRSGEILESHVGWYHNVMSLVHNWYQIQCGAVDPEARKAKLSDELMGELIRFVSSHEIGHTLGLRHNFGASATVPVDSLRDNEYLAKNGFCPSIMDYARFNYVAQPEDNIEIKNLFPRINDYDRWAIEWGYKPLYDATSAEADQFMLSKITGEKQANKRLIWYDGEGYRNDPRRQTEDLGDDAAKANTLGIANLKRIVPELKDWSYWGADALGQRLPDLYTQVLNQYTRYIAHVLNNLTGYHRNPITPDQEGTAFKFPPVEKAKSVVPFMEENVITEPRWLVDVPYADRIIANPDLLMEQIASRVFPSLCLSPVINAVNPQYGAVQYLKDLTEAVMRPSQGGAALTRYQRNIQRMMVNGLSSGSKTALTMLNNDGNTAILMTLRDLREQFKRLQSSDPLTQAHYRQLADQLDRYFAVK